MKFQKQLSWLMACIFTLTSCGGGGGVGDRSEGLQVGDIPISTPQLSAEEEGTTLFSNMDFESLVSYLPSGQTVLTDGSIPEFLRNVFSEAKNAQKLDLNGNGMLDVDEIEFWSQKIVSTLKPDQPKTVSDLIHQLPEALKNKIFNTTAVGRLDENISETLLDEMMNASNLSLSEDELKRSLSVLDHFIQLADYKKPLLDRNKDGKVDMADQLNISESSAADLEYWSYFIDTTRLEVKARTFQPLKIGALSLKNRKIVIVDFKNQLGLKSLTVQQAENFNKQYGDPNKPLSFMGAVYQPVVIQGPEEIPFFSANTNGIIRVPYAIFIFSKNTGEMKIRLCVQKPSPLKNKAHLLSSSLFLTFNSSQSYQKSWIRSALAEDSDVGIPLLSDQALTDWIIEQMGGSDFLTTYDPTPVTDVAEEAYLKQHSNLENFSGRFSSKWSSFEGRYDLFHRTIESCNPLQDEHCCAIQQWNQALSILESKGKEFDSCFNKEKRLHEHFATLHEEFMAQGQRERGALLFEYGEWFTVTIVVQAISILINIFLKCLKEASKLIVNRVIATEATVAVVSAIARPLEFLLNRVNDLIKLIEDPVLKTLGKQVASKIKVLKLITTYSLKILREAKLIGNYRAISKLSEFLLGVGPELSRAIMSAAYDKADAIMLKIQNEAATEWSREMALLRLYQRIEKHRKQVRQKLDEISTYIKWKETSCYHQMRSETRSELQRCRDSYASDVVSAENSYAQEIKKITDVLRAKEEELKTAQLAVEKYIERCEEIGQKRSDLRDSWLTAYHVDKNSSQTKAAFERFDQFNREHESDLCHRPSDPKSPFQKLNQLRDAFDEFRADQKSHEEELLQRKEYAIISAKRNFIECQKKTVQATCQFDFDAPQSDLKMNEGKCMDDYVKSLDFIVGHLPTPNRCGATVRVYPPNGILTPCDMLSGKAAYVIMNTPQSYIGTPTMTYSSSDFPNGINNWHLSASTSCPDNIIRVNSVPFDYEKKIIQVFVGKENSWELPDYNARITSDGSIQRSDRYSNTAVEYCYNQRWSIPRQWGQKSMVNQCEYPIFYARGASCGIRPHQIIPVNHEYIYPASVAVNIYENQLVSTSPIKLQSEIKETVNFQIEEGGCPRPEARAKEIEIVALMNRSIILSHPIWMGSFLKIEELGNNDQVVHVLEHEVPSGDVGFSDSNYVLGVTAYPLDFYDFQFRAGQKYRVTIKAALNNDLFDLEEEKLTTYPDGVSIGYRHPHRVESPEKTISATLIAD